VARTLMPPFPAEMKLVARIDADDAETLIVARAVSRADRDGDLELVGTSRAMSAVDITPKPVESCVPKRHHRADGTSSKCAGLHSMAATTIPAA